MQQSNTHTSFHVQFVTQYLLPLTDTFFGLCPSRNRYIKPLKHYVSEAGSAPVFRQGNHNFGLTGLCCPVTGNSSV